MIDHIRLCAMWTSSRLLERNREERQKWMMNEFRSLLLLLRVAVSLLLKHKSRSTAYLSSQQSHWIHLSNGSMSMRYVVICKVQDHVLLICRHVRCSPVLSIICFPGKNWMSFWWHTTNQWIEFHLLRIEINNERCHRRTRNIFIRRIWMKNLFRSRIGMNWMIRGFQSLWPMKA